ncbi:hypothetical protein V1277_006490 [Bradyrhizobium sp. AZCC 1588]|uniref:hypothetical protein n=1 Tax=unclassified Bradyrhizobium TaxID=2631580 RepID=UPI002FEF710D
MAIIAAPMPDREDSFDAADRFEPREKDIQTVLRAEMLGRIQADGNQTKLGSRAMSVDKCPEAARSGTKLSQPQLIVSSWRGI